MMPLGDEELNALWGRKIGWNTARALGAWGTGVATTVGANLATLNVDFSSLGFNQLPSVDFFQLRGGSQPAVVTNASDTAGVFLGIYPTIGGGTWVSFSIWGDGVNGTLLNFSNYGTWQRDFGTIIYRLRGW